MLPGAELQQELGDGDARAARAVDDDVHILHLLANQPQRVQQTRGDDNRRAVLVIVKDGNIQFLAQAAFDFKAARRGDILQIDAAERRRDCLHRPHNFVHVLRIQTNRECVHVRKFLEQNRLALHDRHRRQRADVAQPQHRRAVGHHRNQVALGGVAVHIARVSMNAAAGFCHAGGIRGGQVIAVLDLHLALYGNFAVVFLVHLQGSLIVTIKNLLLSHTIFGFIRAICSSHFHPKTVSGRMLAFHGVQCTTFREKKEGRKIPHRQPKRKKQLTNV